MALGAFKHGRFAAFSIVDKLCTECEEIRPVRIAPTLVQIRSQVMHRMFKQRRAAFKAEIKTAEFMSFVEIDDDGCWHWTGRAHKDAPQFDGAPASHFILADAGIPRPTLRHRVLHLCENKDCVSPDHMEWNTPRQLGKRSRTIRDAKNG